MGPSILSLIYLIGSVTFILGLKMLSKPDTARKGNLIAAAGMFLAIFGTIFLYKSDGQYLHNYSWIFAGLLIGTIVGVLAAKKVKMTAMPEMVSMFNGMGGACAALISVVEFNHLVTLDPDIFLKLIPPVEKLHGVLQSVLEGDKNRLVNDMVSNMLGDARGQLLIILLGMIIGAVSFAGSVIAWGKLNGSIRDFSFKGQHVVNLLVMAAILVGAVVLMVSTGTKLEAMVAAPADTPVSWTTIHLIFYTILLLSIVYGVLFVLPIGGADMPVVISLLNSFTGVAAACGGFLYNNPVMLTGGILVGSAGTILTILMCKAMNRSLKNVLIGSFGGGQAAAAAGKEQGNYKEISMTDAAVVLAYANKVMIVPGYGLAVAQAQHACHELEKLLGEKGAEVKYAIHPVAGRMPGHMNVLLAEADVPYEKLLEMEEANAELATTDVVLVLGANDVVNPAAKNDPASPIYGMPILEVELARLVIVNKRSMKPGYAGIENELFFQPKTSMLFGDAKQVLQQLLTEIKQV
ncbi:NAD(P)(+) transhydrogenase (Re/Si-specific) subunit beta [Chitinophaga nivalis]|uniref:NAD(P) transhydrogenase subunit beta n=1 Tax=Chitinophaga nivalis TaxID=2991709 RepID=A0ABT3IG30_9BACT|nr:NAD(P)(+) transhydrogenase (Re/Si-specific) subunit beta [Chitinophaga nivalis]MCW3467394.1 NAD(P)(+) transhydrogenase (Re/Si-specific) subunit beta [Chitinophaga nivalis]MCW3482914.1 NAD(P)(+) transhydrogenase (Re/Si-specific) subunit beta [Chitinophaga nivalis]